LPTLWFRNNWSKWIAQSNRAAEKPNLKQIETAAGTSAVAATHPLLGEFILSCEGNVPLLFTENETNHERLFPGQKNESPYVKDGINVRGPGQPLRGKPWQARHQGRGALQGQCRRRSDQSDSPAALQERSTRSVNPSESNLMKSLQIGFVKPTSFTSR
jgi:hypothetical protein